MWCCSTDLYQFTWLKHGYKNNWCQVVQATKFCAVARNNCGPSARNLPHVTLLAPWILRRPLCFLENLWTPGATGSVPEASPLLLHFLKHYTMDKPQMLINCTRETPWDASQDRTRILWKMEVHYRVYVSPPLVPIPSHINPDAPSHPISSISV